MAKDYRYILDAVRPLAVVVATWLTMYWGWFAVTTFPLIVPADHIPEYVRAYEGAAAAGCGLVIVSAISGLLATGVFGRGRVRWGVGFALLVVLACASLWLYPSAWLYPSVEYIRLAPRLPALLAGVVVVVIGAG